jgi:P27 family predicted phage terminase small subunit
MPVLSPVIDAYEVGRYCSAVEDAARARAELDKRGLVLEEVIPDPRGGVAGHRVVVNPAEAALRRADRLLTDLSDRLGLTPAARARLGLTINAAELAGAEADRILGSMFRGRVIDAEEDE